MTLHVKNTISLNCRGKMIASESPLVMGILNVTPDSFHAGSRARDISDAKYKVEQMIVQGADIIDVGAVSTRPHADEVSSEDEQSRLMPILRVLVQEFPEAIFSVDTYRENIAEEALDVGAHIINDIRGGKNKVLMGLCASANAPYIAMHSKGTPQDMHLHTHYSDLLAEMLQFFVHIKEEAIAIGLHDLILDPGFGFAKTMEQNFLLLNHLEIFKILETPILVGVSRKSMIYKPLLSTADEVLSATSAVHMAALIGGAQILRAHDVREAKEVISLYNLLQSSH